MTGESRATLSPLKQAFLAIEDLEAKVAQLEGRDREPIAVVGIGCRFPGGAEDPDGFFRLLREEVDAVVPEPPDGRDTYRRVRPDVAPEHRTMPPAGFLHHDVAQFDPQFFSIAPREAAGMDPQQRLLLEVVWEALEDAAEQPARLRGSPTGVFIGICSNDYAQLQLGTHDSELLNAHFTSGIGHSVASGRISYWLGLRGPSMSIDTACSSSLVATQLACRSLRSGECDMAIAGGVNLILDSDLTVAFMRSGMLSPDGRCRTFADDANGFARAEGCGIVVLKRLGSALADGNRIYAVIRGIAVNQDGASSALSAPSGPAQEAVIRAALANAGLAPADVDYLEAHGTGTELGDPIEMRALGAVFAERAGRPPLVVGSLKTNVGHLESTAGIAGLIKTVLAVHEGFIPRHLHWSTPSRHIAWDRVPIEIASVGRAWPSTVAPRRAGVSSFGFSGTNCHAVIEQAPAAPPRSALVEQPRSLILSATTLPALRSLAARYADVLRAASPAYAADACYTSNVGRAPFRHRLAVLGSGGSFSDSLATWVRDGFAEGVVEGRAPVEPPRIAFAFTGQGSQYAGMGRMLYQQSAPFRAALDACRKPFLEATCCELLDALFDVGASRLADTAIAQPALVALETSLARALIELGARPAAVFGHSIGEFSAACVAGVLSVADAIYLTARRGELMRRTPAGAMLAVAADEATAAEELGPHAAEVSVAAVNGPASVVLSGAIDAIARLEARFSARGVRTSRLDVSRAFHSPLMQPVLVEFERVVSAIQFSAPRVRVISALTGRPASAAELASPSYWTRQLREPVRFAAASEASADYATVVVEVGPRPVLSGFDRGDRASRQMWVPTLRRDAEDRVALLRLLQSLYTAGLDVAWSRLEPEATLRRVRLPTTAFDRERCWVKLRSSAALADSGRAGSGAASRDTHPLLGARIDSPLEHAVFESPISARCFPFVGDHVVAGAVIMPAAGFLEAARAAGERLLGCAVRVEGLELVAALVLPADGARLLQTILTPGTQGATVRLYSRDTAAGSEWTLHASGRVAVLDAGLPAPEPGLIAGMESRCPRPVGSQELYADLARRGLEFGPSLNGVRHGKVGRGEAVAVIALPAGLEGEVARYGVHPAQLDACLQSIALTLQDAAPDELFLPVEVGAFSVFSELPSQCVAHARVEVADPAAGAVRGRVDVYDPEGRRVLELADLRFQRASNATLRGLSTRSLEGYLYSPTWVPFAMASGDAGAIVRDWLASLPADLERRIVEQHARDYERFFADLEELCVDYFAAGLCELGWNHVAAPARADELAGLLGVAPRHGRLFRRALQILGAAGRLREVDGVWQPQPLESPRDPDARLTELLARHPEGRAEGAMVRRCGAALARALRGHCDPLELLFPGGSIDDAEHLYRDSPLAVVFNESIADAVERLAATGRPMRVLEIGAGTGGTASHVLERLGGRVDYTFTDVSPLFTKRARSRFAHHDRVTIRELDIDRDPESQGFENQSFHLILASNVLHATTDLEATLRRVRSLLAPGGTLIAFEVFAPHLWFDLTVGLTPGWWLFADSALRPDYPAIDANAWQRVLEFAGFRHVTTQAGASTGRGVLARQGLVVAQAPTVPAAGAGDWLILADGSGAGKALARDLESRGHRCRVVPAAWLAAQGRAAMAAELAAGPGGRWSGIVHFGALDAAGMDAGSSHELELACRSALDLATCLAVRDAKPASTVWLVTRGAQCVSGDEAVLEPAQATLWGLGKSVNLEHPDLRIRLLDLDPSDPCDQSGAIVPLVTAPAEEHELALRDGQPLAARLVSWRPPASGSRNDEEPYALDLPERGSIDALRFVPAQRSSPQSGQVELRVAATALNFKDVLNVLGLYPGDPGPLGSELAGTVTRVGPDVVGLRAGDRVFGFAAGSFAHFVNAPAAQLMPIPDGLSFERAVTVPVAFLTASYALMQCARLRRGERVLIHSAAGGVGLAAVQVARQTGAVIYATAGTEAKRALLRSMGIAHVYDSRTLDFAHHLLTDTGGAGVHVVLNSLADRFVDASFGVVAPGGRFLEIGKRGIWSPQRVDALGRNIEYHVIDWGETARQDPALIAKLFAEVVAKLRRGELAPLPARVFAIDRVHDAFRYMAQGRHVGKIVMRFPPVRPRDVGKLRADATYLITGGLGGLGLLTAGWLARQGARHIALIGRSEATAAVRQAVAELEAGGVNVRIGRVDLADRAALEAFLVALRLDMPPLRGIVQSAGALDDGVVEHQNWHRFRTVFGAKIDGTQNLHGLTVADPLEFFVLYGSIAGLVGSAGQANHAAANAYLATFAAARRLQGVHALCIDWGPWSGAGAAVRREVLERGAARGLLAFTPTEGLGILELALKSEAVRLTAANVDWRAFLADRHHSLRYFELLRSKDATQQVTVAEERPGAPSWLEEMEAMPAARQRGEVLRFVRAQVVRLLGLRSASVEIDRPMSEMGLDSLLAVEIRNVLGKAFGLTLPATLTFDCPTIEALAAELHARKFGGAPQARGSVAARTDALQSIEAMSDDEIDSMIARKLEGR